MNIFGRDIECLGWLNHGNFYITRRAGSRASIAQFIKRRRFLSALNAGYQPNVS
jgi:hypothetical protein